MSCTCFVFCLYFSNCRYCLRICCFRFSIVIFFGCELVYFGSVIVEVGTWTSCVYEIFFFRFFSSSGERRRIWMAWIDVGFCVECFFFFEDFTLRGFVSDYRRELFFV